MLTIALYPVGLVAGGGDGGVGGHPCRLDFAAAAYPPLPRLSLFPLSPLIRRRFLPVLVCGMEASGMVLFGLMTDGAEHRQQSWHRVLGENFDFKFGHA